VRFALVRVSEKDCAPTISDNRIPQTFGRRRGSIPSLIERPLLVQNHWVEGCSWFLEHRSLGCRRIAGIYRRAVAAGSHDGRHASAVGAQVRRNCLVADGPAVMVQRDCFPLIQSFFYQVIQQWCGDAGGLTIFIRRFLAAYTSRIEIMFSLWSVTRCWDWDPLDPNIF
jgi:hypothetical protein